MVFNVYAVRILRLSVMRYHLSISPEYCQITCMTTLGSYTMCLGY